MNHRATPELLGRLLDEHGGALALFAAQWSEDADDCVQEALLELAQQAELPQNPLAWLYRVVRNRAVSRFRSERRRQRHEEWSARLVARRDAAADPSAETSLDPVELTAALSALPDELREVVVARVWGGLGFEQIAEVTGCSTSTAHRRYAAGLAALRERLLTPCPLNTNAPS